LQRLMVPSPRRLPHNISLLEEAGFELSVPHEDLSFRPLPMLLKLFA
jgi:hypothetical protein